MVLSYWFLAGKKDDLPTMGISPTKMGIGNGQEDNMVTAAPILGESWNSGSQSWLQSPFTTYWFLAENEGMTPQETSVNG